MKRRPTVTRWPWFGYAARREERLVHRRSGLLDLQEAQVVRAGALRAARGTRASRRCPPPPPGGRRRRRRSGRGGSAAPRATTTDTRRRPPRRCLGRHGRRGRGTAVPRPGEARPSTTSVNFFAAPTLDRFLARLWSLARDVLALLVDDDDAEQILGRDLLVPDVEEPGARHSRRSGCGTRRGRRAPPGPLPWRSSVPWSRASTCRLATIRITSHSNGPASVSSKSRRSNESCRSGVAHNPKLRTWASPHNCTIRPLWGREARSAAITAAAPR